MQFFWPVYPDGEGHFDIPGAAGAGDDDPRRGRTDFRAAQGFQEGRYNFRLPQDGNVDFGQQGGGEDKS